MTTLGKTAIEWVRERDGVVEGGTVPGATLNPITGCLGPDGSGPCSYCFAKRMATRFGDSAFKPTWHPERLLALAGKKPRTVFMCSMSDPVGVGVPAAWSREMACAMRFHPQHTYLMLTKRPDRVPDGLLNSAPNLYSFWLGTSVESGAFESTQRIGQLRKVEVAHRFLSFEPLLGDIGLHAPDLKEFSWVIIGAQTGPGAKLPRIEWIADIIEACARACVPVFVKDNAQVLAPELFSCYRALPYLAVHP